MPDAQTLLALAAKIEKLDGPSREMDARIDDLIGPSVRHPRAHLFGSGGNRMAWLLHNAQLYTASVDRCLALLAEALPGHAWSGCSCSLPNGAATSSIRHNGRGPHGYVAPATAAARTLALSFCAAICRAKAQEAGNG